MNCLFCAPPEGRLLLANDLAFSMGDGFPVTTFHSLVVPRRHARDYFELTPDELMACDQLLRRLSQQLRSQDATIGGFNIGLNCGEAAGQTIFHCHFHIIPRRRGDVPNPRGGVRHVIPGKGSY